MDGSCDATTLLRRIRANRSSRSSWRTTLPIPIRQKRSSCSVTCLFPTPDFSRRTAIASDGKFDPSRPAGLVELDFTVALPSSKRVFMVRAIKLEQTASGNYLSPSQGIFAGWEEDALVQTVRFGVVTADRNELGLRISSLPDVEVTVEESLDLVRWRSVATVLLRSDETDTELRIPRQGQARFYRARQALRR